MKRMITITVVLALVELSMVALAGESKKDTIAVKGMTCSGCARTIKSKVEKLDGVTSVNVDLKAGQATIEYDPEKITPDRMCEVINKMGYKASPPQALRLEPSEGEKKAHEPKKEE